MQLTILEQEIKVFSDLRDMHPPDSEDYAVMARLVAYILDEYRDRLEAIYLGHYPTSSNEN